MQTEKFHTLLRFFKALADESRLKILGILANHECSVEELAVLLQLKEPTVSHHLTKLKDLNLVSMQVEGSTHLYQLNTDVMRSISKEIFSPDSIASLIEVETEAWSSKVLKNYLLDERLKEIPASRKKRLVILKWLANQFEVGITYPEQDVNQIIKRYHPDCATLRRELVGYNLMQRSHGVYWRLDAIQV
jgi:DNA-binding transcriptional ArsR family regulator